MGLSNLLPRGEDVGSSAVALQPGAGHMGTFTNQARPASPADNQAASLVISMIGGLMVEETVFETRREVSPVQTYQLLAPCILVIYMQSLLSLRLT